MNKARVLKIKIYDPNTEQFETMELNIDFLGIQNKFGQSVGKICAKKYLNYLNISCDKMEEDKVEI